MSIKLKNATTVAEYQSFLSGGLPGDTGLPTGPNPKPGPSQTYNGAWCNDNAAPWSPGGKHLLCLLTSVPTCLEPDGDA